MYKPNILIVGASGTGKSASLRKLPTDRSVHIIDTELKGFPIKSSFPVVKHVERPQDFRLKIKESCDDPKCRVIIIDSLTKQLENWLNFCRGAFKNYDIWTQYNQGIKSYIDAFKSQDKIIVVTAIDDFVETMSDTGTSVKVRRASTLAGKEWEGKLEKDFLVCLYTDVKKEGEKTTGNIKMQYRFLTNTDGVCSAKSPLGMFNNLFIDNDLAVVIDAVNKYNS